MKQRIASYLLRFASIVAGTTRQPDKNILAIGTYKITCAIVRLLGGSVESRIMSFVVPDKSNDELRVTHILQELESALSLKGMPLRICKKQFSRDEAMKADSVRPLVPDGTDQMTYYELFVATQYYWKASSVVESVLHGSQVAENKS